MPPERQASDKGSRFVAPMPSDADNDLETPFSIAHQTPIDVWSFGMTVLVRLYRYTLALLLDRTLGNC